MSKEAIGYIIRRCLSLLKKDGTKKVKEEYHFWISWLKKELKKYKNDDKIIKLVNKDKYLKKAKLY